MDVISYTDARAHLKDVMDRAVADRTPIVVTRQKAESVVILSLTEWNGVAETLHLLSSARNAERLTAAIAQLEAGEERERALIVP
jgi:antitoxin YefM